MLLQYVTFLAYNMKCISKSLSIPFAAYVYCYCCYWVADNERLPHPPPVSSFSPPATASSNSKVHPWRTQRMGKNTVLLRAQSSSPSSSSPSRSSKKNPKLLSKNRSRRRSSRKEDVNAVLTGMGLQTVPPPPPPPKAKSRLDSERTESSSSSPLPPLQLEIDIDVEAQLCYARNGHAVVRQLVSPSIANLTDLRTQLLHLAQERELEAWQQKVQVAANSNNDNHQLRRTQVDDTICTTIEGCQEALKTLGVTASLPFLQYFNTWQTLPDVKRLAYSLGQAASILMDVPTVRLYQDALFWKRRNDGPTPWHIDARMAPFDTAQMITFWIPLQAIVSKKEGGTALQFCSKSHVDMALPYWNPIPNGSSSSFDNADDSYASTAWDRLEGRYPKQLVHYMPMQLGDATVHSGWTLHCSNGNDKNSSTKHLNEDRMAIAITFVDGAAEIRQDWKDAGDNEDRWSYEAWCHEVVPRTKFTHSFVPIVWPPSSQTHQMQTRQQYRSK